MSSIVLESDLLQFLLIIIQDAIGENYEPNPAMRGSYERINEHSIVQAIKRTFQSFFASVQSPQRSSNGSRVGVAMSPKAQLALLFLEANLHRKLAVKEIAVSVDLTPSGLRYLFKTQIGASPSRYLKEVRLQRSRELLQTSSKPVKEVAYEVGYCDCTRFMRDFKRAYGTRPSQYRSEYRLTPHPNKERSK